MPSVSGRDSNTAPVNAITASLLSLNLDWLACAVDERLPDHIRQYVDDMAADLSRDNPAIETHLVYGGELLLLSRGSAGELVLKNDYFRLALATEDDVRKGMAPASVTLYSICFWSVGIGQAFATLQAWCDDLWGFHLLPLRATRVDICVDLKDAPMPSKWQYAAWEDSFIRRSKVSRNIAKGAQVETVYFGSPKASLKLRAYNKSLELEHSGKDYYKPMWSQNGYVDGDVVTRFEWQCGSAFLREWLGSDGSRIETLDDLLRMLPGMYRYLCGAAPAFGKAEPKGWIRQAVPSESTRHDRWETSPMWEVVQSATFRLSVEPLNVSRQAEKRVKLDKLKGQLFGVVKSAMALVPGGRYVNREELARGFYRWTVEYEMMTGESIEAGIERRYCELHAA